MIPDDDVPFEVRSVAHLASMEIGEWVVDRSRKHPREIVADAIMADRASRLPRQDDEIRKAALEEAEAIVKKQAPAWVQEREGKYWEGYRDAIDDAAEEVRALSQKGDEADG